MNSSVEQRLASSFKQLAVETGYDDLLFAMNRAIAVNRLRPIIDRAFSVDDVLGAFRYNESGQMFGKVVISHTQEAR